MIVLNNERFREICDFIRKYKGLAIDCQEALVNKFPDVPKLTLGKKTDLFIKFLAKSPLLFIFFSSKYLTT